MEFIYEIRADVARNRLYLRLQGFMSDDDARKVADTIIATFPKLRPGFDVLNDIRDLKPTSQKGAEHMQRAQEASARYGVRRVIRIVGKQVTTQMQWNRTLKAAQGNWAETAATVEEAERMLESGT